MIHKKQAKILKCNSEFGGDLSYTGDRDEPPLFGYSRVKLRNVFASNYPVEAYRPALINDGLPQTFWDASPQSKWQSSSWVAWNLTHPQVVKRYSIMTMGDDCPTGWTLEGSNAPYNKFDPSDLVHWEVLDYHYGSPQCDKDRVLQQHNDFSELYESKGENYVKFKCT